MVVGASGACLTTSNRSPHGIFTHNSFWTLQRHARFFLFCFFTPFGVKLCLILMFDVSAN